MPTPTVPFPPPGLPPFGFYPYTPAPGGNPAAGTAGGSSPAGGTAVFNSALNSYFNAQGVAPIYYAYRQFSFAELQNPNPPGGQVYSMIACPTSPANVTIWPLMIVGKSNQDAGGWGVAQNIQVRYNGIAQDLATFAMIGAGANTRFAWAAISQSTAFAAAGRTLKGRNIELSFATANLGGGNAANTAQVWIYYTLMLEP